MRKGSILAMLLFGLLLTVIISCISRVKALDPALVRIINPVTGDAWFNFTRHDKNLGDTFLMNITVDNVTGLGSWQIAVKWNTSILEYIGAKIILFNQDFTVPENRPSPVFINGTLYCGATVMPGQPSLGGSAVLAQVTLKTLTIGQTNLTLENETSLWDNINGVDIPFAAFNAFYSYSVSADVNGDGTVNIKDVTVAVSAFNSFLGKSNWNPYADLNNDGIVNIRDIAIIIFNFNKQL